MAKLFITLYLMVFASFGVFILLVLGIHALGESIGDGANIDERVSIGTFKLLNKSMAGLDQQQTKKRLEHYQQLFGKEFKLAPLSEFNFDKDELETLASNHVLSRSEERTIPLTEDEKKLVIDEEEVNILYYQSNNPSLVWRTELDYEFNLSINSQGVKVEVTPKNFAQGMYDLLQQELHRVPQSEWPKLLKTLETTFKIPLSLSTLRTLKTKLQNLDEQLPSLNKNKIINTTQKTNFATFIKPISNSDKLLQIGPVEIPWYLRNLPVLTLLAFFIAFASTLFLWLLPFWTNLNKIKKASNEFGSGNYKARVSHRLWSPIAKVSSAFNSMAEQTENSIRSQKELTSAVSHELRTPVARMRFALEMLSNTHEEKKKKRFISDINENIEELDELLEELLSYARFDNDNVTLKITSNKIAPWFNQTIERLKPLSGKIELSHQTIGISPSESTLFEARLMTRAVDNIIQNAFRYAHSRVDVTLDKNEGSYQITIDDDGEGIPKEERETIFDAFSRLDSSRNRASGGFGLGLAIVDKIIKAHDGQVAIHNSPLGGARFQIQIPAQQP